ncbi:hypothetical protein ABZY68_27665 [Streptomyces sp. NPDC006482]
MPWGRGLQQQQQQQQQQSAGRHAKSTVASHATPAHPHARTR